MMKGMTLQMKAAEFILYINILLYYYALSFSFPSP